MLLKTLAFLIIVALLSCQQEKDKDIQKSLDRLIESEKYDIAKEKIRKNFEKPRKTDEILSFNKPIVQRQLELSSDRNRVVWSEDKKIIFRDLANPSVKVKKFPKYFESISPSANTDFVIVLFRDQSGQGCKQVVTSKFKNKKDYESNATISCNDRPSISNDGKYLYYFLDESLYKESTENNENIKVIVKKKQLKPKYKRIENKALLYPINNLFFIFLGNAGSYNLYWYNPNAKKIKKFASNILIPKLFYGGNDKAHVIAGEIGKFLIREIKLSSHNKVLISKGFEINKKQLYSWQLSGKHEFISAGSKGIIVKWGIDYPTKAYPIICERFWGVARDQILYESKTGELVLSHGVFSEEDWKLLDTYKNLIKMDID